MLGMILLTLNFHYSPNLTWRDPQHLIVLTSKRNHLQNRPSEVSSGGSEIEIHEWQLNGAGLEFNHLFGYGVLDASDLVDLAITWETVPERFHCEAKTVTVNRYVGNRLSSW